MPDALLLPRLGPQAADLHKCESNRKREAEAIARWGYWQFLAVWTCRTTYAIQYCGSTRGKLWDDHQQKPGPNGGGAMLLEILIHGSLLKYPFGLAGR